jgi:signal transduction histidine kinase
MKTIFLLIFTFLLSVNKGISEYPAENGILGLSVISYTSSSPQSTNHFVKRSLLSSSCLGVQQDTTRELVSLVKSASALVHEKGEESFIDFRISGSPWRKGEKYIFVLNPDGKMIVHPDPDLEGKNQLELKDINGKPIIRGLLDAATKFPDKAEGWYHYEWPVPGGLLPRWKSSYVKLVKAPSGKSYIVGSGMYNDLMEREFVVDAVKGASAQIEKNDKEAFRLFHDPSGPFMVKDAYIFVIDPAGIDLVNPGFKSLEGRNIMDMKDKSGKFLVREMFKVIKSNGSGWVDYMWPKPGKSVSTRKSTYVTKAKRGDSWVLVGCGVYLTDAPKAIPKTEKMTAPELIKLVREAATIFEKQGEKAFPEFRKKGSKWFRGDNYFFVWTLDGVRYFHADNPSGEGLNMSDAKDVLGRPWGKMLLETSASSKGEGWFHYMYPEPGDIFPTWKSSFVKRVTFPSGVQYNIGCGIYNMDIDKTFIEDVVNRASNLVEKNGKEAFVQLRDKTGPFYFMDTYVFVDNLDGVEFVNPGHPSLEGKNLSKVKDVHGKLLVKDYIDAAVKNGDAWEDYYWYKPGESVPVKKHTYVKTVKFAGETFVVGAGYYQ